MHLQMSKLCTASKGVELQLSLALICFLSSRLSSPALMNLMHCALPCQPSNNICRLTSRCRMSAACILTRAPAMVSRADATQHVSSFCRHGKHTDTLTQAGMESLRVGILTVSELGRCSCNDPHELCGQSLASDRRETEIHEWSRMCTSCTCADWSTENCLSVLKIQLAHGELCRTVIYDPVYLFSFAIQRHDS